MKLLTSNSKLEKCKAHGYLAVGLQLAPGKISGHEVCPSRGKCFATCIFTSGHGAFDSVKDARIARTKILFADRAAFIAQLNHEIELAEKRALSSQLSLAVRLNVFSDLDWTSLVGFDFFEDNHPEVQFYDYTKVRSRMERWLMDVESKTEAGKLPTNYHMTWSHNEREPDFSLEVLSRGGSVAIAQADAANQGTVDFTYKLLRAKVREEQFVDGDLHDLTFLHPPSSLIVLSAKGKAKGKKANGFLI